jgi:predicted nucleotidyltransferase
VSENEGRYQRACTVAQAATELLQTQFGAGPVRVFGSLLHPEYFDERSDVDLIVWGLRDYHYYHAVSRLLSLAPDISVDLVAAEHASPRLLAVVEQTMQPAAALGLDTPDRSREQGEGLSGLSMGTTGYAALAARIREELGQIEQLVERTGRQLEKWHAQEDEDYLDAIALNLHGFYTAVERLFEQIARHVDGGIPSGAEWHRDLLRQMSAEVSGVRPVVLNQTARTGLEEYRGLRHVIRNLYATHLNPVRIAELAAMLPSCFAAVADDLRAFCRYLENNAPASG